MSTLENTIQVRTRTAAIIRRVVTEQWILSVEIWRDATGGIVRSCIPAYSGFCGRWVSTFHAIKIGEIQDHVL